MKEIICSDIKKTNANIFGNRSTYVKDEIFKIENHDVITILYILATVCCKSRPKCQMMIQKKKNLNIGCSGEIFRSKFFRSDFINVT